MAEKIEKTESKKTKNQKKLIGLLTAFVTEKISDTDHGKSYLQTLAENDPQKALNKIGSTHADVMRAVQELSPDSPGYNKEDYEVAQAIDATLIAYNGSKKDEEVAIGVIESMSQQIAAHDANMPDEPVVKDADAE